MVTVHPLTRSLNLAVRGLMKLTDRQRSPTGWANPRTRSLTPFRYALGAYQAFYPNTVRGLDPDAELFPAVLQVQTINRCNATCVMCPYPYTTASEPRQVMSDSLWRKLADECAKAPELAMLVPMSKNEPLLDRQLDERVRYFRERARPEQKVEVVTNGTLLDGDRLARLADAGVDAVSISVNAATPDAYQATMPGLKWERIIEQLRSLRPGDKARVAVFLRFIRQQGNYRDERRFERLWTRRGFNVIIYGVNNRAGTVRDFTAVREPDTLAMRLRRAARRVIARRLFPVCPLAFSVGNVLANGDVPLCSNDWHNREVLGNAGKQSLREIYNSPRARELRDLMRVGRYDEISPCRDCTLWQDSTWL